MCGSHQYKRVSRFSAICSLAEYVLMRDATGTIGGLRLRRWSQENLAT